MEPQPVDEESGSAVDPAAGSAHEIGADVSAVFFRCQCVAQSCPVQPHFLGQFRKERGTEAALVLKKRIVHLPELTLRSGELCRLRRSLGLGMNFVQWKVAEHKTQSLAKVFLHVLDDGVSASTMRTLVVAVLDERARRFDVALNVILGTNRNFERRHE